MFDITSKCSSKGNLLFSCEVISKVISSTRSFAH